MTRIAISEHSLVDFSAERWRLIHIEDLEAPKLVVEAKQDQPFRYNGYFAVSRDLPEAGEIALGDLGQVVLGWSQEAASWQLGLTLSPDFARLRSSRWFEVLRLAHPDPAEYQAAATQVGKALAAVLSIPFATTTAIEPEPEPEPIALEALPLELGIWRLDAGGEAEGELQFQRSPSWLRGKQRQLAWYAFLVLLYTWVSIATLTGDLGLPNAGTLIPDPSWLPYLGLVVAVLLILAIARQALLMLRAADRLRISASHETVSAWRGSVQLWQLEASAVQAVYVSEVFKKRGRRPTVLHGEINLHLLDGSFLPLLINADKVVDAALPSADADALKQLPAGINALEADEAQTAMQAAAAHVAVTLGDLPLYYDRRTR